MEQELICNVYTNSIVANFWPFLLFPGLSIIPDYNPFHGLFFLHGHRGQLVRDCGFEEEGFYSENVMYMPHHFYQETRILCDEGWENSAWKGAVYTNLIGQVCIGIADNQYVA